MELALPFIALSGLYVISNQNNEKPEKKFAFLGTTK